MKTVIWRVKVSTIIGGQSVTQEGVKESRHSTARVSVSYFGGWDSRRLQAGCPSRPWAHLFASGASYLLSRRGSLMARRGWSLGLGRKNTPQIRATQCAQHT